MASNFTVLGVPLSNIDESGLDQFIRDRIESRGPCYVVTPNLNIARLASENLEFAQAIRKAHLQLCDSRILFRIARLRGRRLPAILTGSDVTPRYLHLARIEGWRVFLFGSDAETLERVRIRHPECVVGCCSPITHGRIWELEEENREYVLRIRTARPDLLFVALGAVKQEMWADKFHHECGVPVTFCIGASLDFVAGKVDRAPAFIRKMSCEWLWRIAQEPRRLLGRYLRDALFFCRAIWKN